MKKLSKNEIKDLILKLFNENRLIAVLNRSISIIYYYDENSDVVELKLNTEYDGNYRYEIGSVINEMSEMVHTVLSSDNIFYEPSETFIMLKNINQKMIDKGYLKFDIDDTIIQDDNIIDIGLIIGLIFPNLLNGAFISYKYLTNNIIELLPLEIIKKAISIKNNYLNMLNANFSFIDKRVESLTDEEKLLLKL